jgi:hypothetical protein
VLRRFLVGALTAAAVAGALPAVANAASAADARQENSHAKVVQLMGRTWT